MDIRRDREDGGASCGADPLRDSDHEQYQDTDKLCTNLLEEHHINMEQTPATNIYGYPTSNNELYCLNDEETSYTGMNKEESRKAASAREKNIQIVAYLLAKFIVIYRDILVVCSSSVTLADRRNNRFHIIVGPQGPASEQYIGINLVYKNTLRDIWPLQKEEEVHSLLVYWYFFIMGILQIIKCGIDDRKYLKIFQILGRCVTPLMRNILDIIYKKHRKDITENFESFIIRIMPKAKYDNMFDDEKKKIRQEKNFDISLMKKIMKAYVNFYTKPKVLPSVVNDYKQLNLKFEVFFGSRNDHCHNLLEYEETVINDYANEIKRLESSVKHLETFINKYSPTPYKDIKYMKLNSLSTLPLYDIDFVIIMILTLYFIYLFALYIYRWYSNS